MKVERIEVKKCLVASEKGKALKGKKRPAYQSGLDEIRKEVQCMTEEKLNNFIMIKDPHRLENYNRMVWGFEKCSIDDLGVWCSLNQWGVPEGAAGLPGEWCIGSVRETAQKIHENPLEMARLKVQARDKRAVENLCGILEVADLLLDNPFSAPIVLPGGTLRKPPSRKMQGDIDDGCLRAIAFTLKGYKTFSAYVGTLLQTRN